MCLTALAGCITYLIWHTVMWSILFRLTYRRFILFHFQILKEISTLFPFFKGNYKGWRDSVRHNLSSYDCFVKVCVSEPRGRNHRDYQAMLLTCSCTAILWSVMHCKTNIYDLKKRNTPEKAKSWNYTVKKKKCHRKNKWIKQWTQGVSGL